MSSSPACHEGILLLNKPAGKPAFFLVKFLRRILGVKKIGHAGTLDPFATGVMVMLVGKNYTRKSDRFLNHHKEYIATVLLGVSTDSYDCDGQITGTCERVPTRQELEEALTRFQGEIEQVPPMFSAKKINGKKLYELARKGEEVERKPAFVKVETDLQAYEYPFVKLKINCSKGTYVRSIAHDLGKILECGAHLSQLERTRSGPFSIEDCTSVDELSSENLSIEKLLIRETD